MTYIYQSSHPNIIYDMLLEKMSKVETTYYVIESYSSFCGIWYELYSDELPPMTSEHGAMQIDMVVRPIKMFSPKHYVETKVVRAINKIMRRIDDSRTRATERAIRRLQRENLCDCGYSYWKNLESIISEIVNGEI